MHRLFALLQIVDQCSDALDRYAVETLGDKPAIVLDGVFELLAFSTHDSPLRPGGRERAALSVIDKSRGRIDDESQQCRLSLVPTNYLFCGAVRLATRRLSCRSSTSSSKAQPITGQLRPAPDAVPKGTRRRNLFALLLVSP
jgi:hypothetical protein